MNLRGLSIYGPLSSDLQDSGIVPVHKFLLTGRFDAQFQVSLPGADPRNVTVRRIINTTSIVGTVRTVMADGTTVTFPIAANGELTGMFNQVLAAGTTIAASALIGDV